MLSPVKINNIDAQYPRVLVAPLDWGLGHATRCIPIIKELLNQRCNVIIAATDLQETLLRGEFPSLTFVKLPGYCIKYDKNRALTILRLLRSAPKILIRIKRENTWLRQFAAREGLDLVISDNRYGLTTPGIPCIFITHQLLIKTPFGPRTDLLLQKLNYRLIGKFSQCWVPDTEQAGLAGELSHPQRMPPIPTRYIGWLSRFNGGIITPPHENTLLVLLSGPEPQRTIFEKLILRQALEIGPHAGPRLILVRGLPKGGPALPPLPSWIGSHDHLPASALETVIREADLVVARTGYSTIMDLKRLGKQALLVPTPGQTEQEYLGKYLAGKHLTSCVDQNAFSLAEAFKLAGNDAAPRLTYEAAHEELQKEIRIVLMTMASSNPRKPPQS